MRVLGNWQEIGRTKGGANTKLTAIVEGSVRAVVLSLAEGLRHVPCAVESLLHWLRYQRAVED